MVILWIVVFAAALIIEAASFALVSIWFAAELSALLLQLLSARRSGYSLSFSVFLAGLLLIFTRPLLKKLFPHKFIPTNSELEVGKTAVVIEDIDNETGSGRVKLGGVNWAAVSADGEKISAGITVTVREIRSAKLVVERNLSDTNANVKEN